MKVLVTGASGFVGSAFLARAAIENRFSLRAALRSDVQVLPPSVVPVFVEGLSATADWREGVKECDAVVHTAARVHVMHDTSYDPLTEFRRVNVEGSLKLARQAVESGVKRFIYISSIKVNGEETVLGKPFTADDPPAAVDPYGISKREAEEGLKQLATDTGMEVVIIRPPLVYGPGVKANFLSMMRWLNKGVPLPLGAINNQRSLVAMDNLVDLIVTCIDNPAAANQTFLAGDGEDLSTSQLLRRMAAAMGKPARLLPVPAWMLEAGASLLGRRAVALRLCGSLQVDITKAHRLLNWIPPVSVDEALRKTARHFLEAQFR
jgi:nucleoside-diphosphate-sugar epimerase